MATVVARAPGRVNLIGDHTDYTGGLCLPMAIDRSVVVRGVRDAAFVDVRIESETGGPAASLPLVIDDPATIEPEWARYVAGVIAHLRPTVGFRGRVESTIPAGAGLSSSAALEIAVALALGARSGTDPERLALARLCQAAEHAARGVPTGLLDQMASIFGIAGHGLLIDCQEMSAAPVALPPADHEPGAPGLVQRADAAVALVQPTTEVGRGDVAVAPAVVTAELVVDVPHGERGMIPVPGRQLIDEVQGMIAIHR